MKISEKQILVFWRVIMSRSVLVPLKTKVLFGTPKTDLAEKYPLKPEYLTKDKPISENPKYFYRIFPNLKAPKKKTLI